MTNNQDYPYVVRWHRLMGSYDYYITDRVQEARRDQAPPNAVHRRDDGTWVTTDDIRSSITRNQLGLDPLPPQEPDLPTLAEELREHLARDWRLTDMYGLTTVERVGDEVLRLKFSTGCVAELEVRLRAPSRPEQDD